MNTAYLDHNATTPPAPAVVQAMCEGMAANWANPSSQHPAGQAARRALAQARATVARFLGCQPAELVFTSGATEANHLAVQGALALPRRPRLLFSAVEHAGLRKLVLALPPARVGWLPVLRSGTLDLAAALPAIADDVGLVSVMAANNETGVCMPIAALAEAAHARGALLHVDATQWIGKQAFDFAAFGADLVSLSAHKFHGPKGIGALVVRRGLAWPAVLPGSQERGRRGGTENLPAILGFAAAAQRLLDGAAPGPREARIAALRDRLEAGLRARLPGTVVFGAAAPRLPNTSCLRFGALPAEVVLQRLERLGIAASSGAACASAGTEPSHVLTAMGVPRDEALGAIRFSLGETSTAAEVQHVLDTLPALLFPLLQAAAPAPPATAALSP
jgi:cysteine desulfurase